MHWKLAHLRSTHFSNIFINIHKFSEVFVTIIRPYPIQFSINIQLARNGTVSALLSVYFGIPWQKSWKLDDCKLKKFSQCHHTAHFVLFFPFSLAFVFFFFVLYSSKIICDCFSNPLSFACYCRSKTSSHKCTHIKH